MVGAEVVRSSSAGEWLGEAEGFLRAAEGEESLGLGLAMAARDSEGVGRGRPGWTVREGDGVVACAFLPGSGVLVLSRAPGGAVDALAAALAGSSNVGMSGAVGPEAVSERFAREYAAARGIGWRRHWTLLLHRLGELERPAGVHGVSRPATMADAERVAEWLAAFHRDTGALVALADPRSHSERLIGAGRAYLHEVGGVAVALAGWSRPTGRTCTINMVYTPPEHRRRGYARSLTVHLADVLRARGTEEVLLFTNEAEPGPNALYGSLGFVPFARFVEVVFEG